MPDSTDDNIDSISKKQKGKAPSSSEAQKFTNLCFEKHLSNIKKFSYRAKLLQSLAILGAILIATTQEQPFQSKECLTYFAILGSIFTYEMLLEKSRRNQNEMYYLATSACIYPDFLKSKEFHSFAGNFIQKTAGGLISAIGIATLGGGYLMDKISCHTALIAGFSIASATEVYLNSTYKNIANLTKSFIQKKGVTLPSIETYKTRN